MSEQVARDIVTDPEGNKWAVSTVKTLAGGASESPNGFLGFFKERDYENETPWPYETMVFKNPGSFGQYHWPSNSLEDAKWHHADILKRVGEGAWFKGTGVKGWAGVPDTTPEQWFDRNPNVKYSVSQIFKHLKNIWKALSKA